MKLLDSLIENDPNFKIGYQCAIDDMKLIFENAKIFNPKMDIIDLVKNWEIIITSAQKHLHEKGKTQ